MKLVVGLGNPGRKYEGTRHNIGFDAVAELSRRHAADPPRSKFDAVICECRMADEKVLLVMPQTFMNLSGRSVRQVCDFYQLPLEDLLVLCDDFQLPVGRIRLRARGTDGGQKGLADVLAKLGTNEVARLRIGIGPVPERWEAHDFVLSKFERSERAEVDRQLARTCDAAEKWVADGIQTAMNEFNRNEPAD